MVFTNKQREKLVLDLYNQGKTIKEIAKEARMSFRDIGAILHLASKEREVEEEKAQQQSQSSQAYKLFSKGDSPIQVAIALNIREPEISKYYNEYWNLTHIHSLGEIYEQTNGEIVPLIHLYRYMKFYRMDIGQVKKLLEIANNDLPAVDAIYQRCKEQVSLLEIREQTLYTLLASLERQVINLKQNIEYYNSEAHNEMMKRNQMLNEKMNMEAIVRDFENNNEQFKKIIRTTVERCIQGNLSDTKQVLALAVTSVLESIKNNPDKYRSFLYESQQQSQKLDNFDRTGNCKALLVDEVIILYNKLAKECKDKVIADYKFRISPLSLPLKSQIDDQLASRQEVKKTTLAYDGYNTQKKEFQDQEQHS